MSRTFFRFSIMLIFLFAPIACQAANPSPEETQSVNWKVKRTEQYIDRDVAVCFDPGSGLNPDQVSLHLTHCYSSSCSDFLDRTTTVQVDPNQQTIQVHSSFKIDLAPLEQMCTQDCVTPNSQADLPKMEPGTYQVTLGNSLLGSVEFPLYGSICFSWVEPGQPRAAFTPTPTSYEPYPERRSTVYPPPVIWTQTPEPYPSQP